MAASQLSLIFDDNASDVVYGGGSWTSDFEAPWYGGESIFPAFAGVGNNGTFGTLSMTFEGTTIAFFGNTPTVFTDSQVLTVSIDGDAPYNTTYGDPNPPSYRQWYQSPTLAEGRHTILLTHIASTSIDYSVVTVGSETPLSGKQVILDNEDPIITYSGRWQRNLDQFISSVAVHTGNPYQNSTHQTTNPGDTFIFRFSGTSAALYGIYDWSTIGQISATYTLDGAINPQTYHVFPTTPQFVSGTMQQENFLFFSFDDIPAGDHTLVVNVTACVNQTFALDYITYTPSFATLATMPNLTTAAAIKATSTTSLSNGQPTSTSALKAASSRKESAAPIIGGVVGGVLFSILASVLLWLRIRKRRAKLSRVISKF
ncbi:hypothetical protein B0H34DRAFT_661801 [Crassisporium funariophilum]|nr:hypothetical protein B0H34DRAFT_661801 [Crassisporium funariophilum]